MGSPKHTIKVSAYEPGTTLYYVGDGRRFTGSYFAYNGITKTLSKTITLLDTKREKCYTSAAKDQYGNKDCRHSYYSIDATLDTFCIPGLRTEDTISTYGTYRAYYVNNVLVSGHNYLGSSVVDSGGYQMKTTEYSPDRIVILTYKNGKLQSTFTRTLLSCVPPTSSLTTNRWRLTYKDSTVYNKSVLNLADYSNTSSELVYPTKIGVVSNAHLPSKEALLAMITSQNTFTYKGHFCPDNIVDEIYENLTIPDVNNIENLKDFKDIKESLPPIIKLLRKRNFKSLAEFYLWYKYTYSTTKLDLQAYYEFFHKWAQDSQSKQNIKRTNLKYESLITENDISDSIITRYQIISDTYNAGVLQSLGLSINLSNVWDTLPFSFVLDWFINLGDILSRLDHYEIVSHLKVRSVITSTKRVVEYHPLRALNCATPCYYGFYDRSIDRVFPLGNITLSLKNPGTHLLDGTALLIASKS